ncbi:uncharacterized protein CELE_K03B8.14 [Caenorhabditis elegans]|uniref:Uncharacterized protein n=1 Tax=Caenorhabditis elegans TaxID=6239 RepID=C9IY27_CAEEL|nr:Uncharacterized protein CELE_K03B8.14 [Caenorhabditis elegans]CBG22741.1 Uncharacterized protein CELE_K03B8.14 [Caenorhabditis elegans]|eukprot:NP_001256319.1 Uncharacterized protein CELE_K03B8.14 [Caenorhabditis elegans]
MRLLFPLFVLLLVVTSSFPTGVISLDEQIGKNAPFSKKAVFDLPGEIQHAGVTGDPKFVKQEQ